MNIHTENVSQEVLEDRFARVRSWMKSRGLSALVVYGSPRSLGSGSKTSGYVHYVAGWMSWASAAMVVVAADGPACVLTVGPHDTRAFEMRASWLGEIEATGSLENYPEAAARALKRFGVEAGSMVGVVGAAEMSHAMYGGVTESLASYQMQTADEGLATLRLIKHPQEVEMHRISASISDAMLATAMNCAVRPGTSGAALMAEVEHTGRSLGAGTSSCWLAIGAAPVTTYFEFMELSPSVCPGDRVQLGTTLSYEGYFGQGLRIGVRGTPSSRIAELDVLLREIQDAALAQLKPGGRLHTVSDTIESMIDEACPYSRDSDPFRFQSCHGLGLSYVEPGMARDLNARRDRSLDAEGALIEENMVIEIHPNFTIPGLGHVCAGDMALVGRDGAEWLTKFPRGLFEL